MPRRNTVCSLVFLSQILIHYFEKQYLVALVCIKPNFLNFIMHFFIYLFANVLHQVTFNYLKQHILTLQQDICFIVSTNDRVCARSTAAVDGAVTNSSLLNS